MISVLIVIMAVLVMVVAMLAVSVSGGFGNGQGQAGKDAHGADDEVGDEGQFAPEPGTTRPWVGQPVRAMMRSI